MKTSDHTPILSFFNFDLYPLNNQPRTPTPSTIPSSQKPSYTILGKNKKQLLLLVNSNITEKQIEFLKKILAAINYDIQIDVALVKSDEIDRLQFEHLQKELQAKQILFFITLPKQLINHLTQNHVKYKAVSYQGKTLIFADPLQQIAENQQLKKQLWIVLQNVFLK
ncbi:MAG: hypothetical protein MK212_11265 [Saprospiraceae bacterium]|nr:hypothetical protein [Saprospiraceae bacterium]